MVGRVLFTPYHGQVLDDSILVCVNLKRMFSRGT